MKKLICNIIFFVFCINKLVGQNRNDIGLSTATYLQKVTLEKFSKGVNIEKYLPRYYSKNGDIDYTSFLQKGIDENNIIIMPDFPIMIKSIGLNLRSNTKILFQKNSVLILKPNDLEAYKVLSLENLQNVEIYSPKIIGDREKHLSNKGQWGMGISIKGGLNIYVYNPIISKCWGDGIYISNNKINIPDRIMIYKGKLDNNRRNGISIISAKNVVISDIIITNTKGQNPQSGIDIEPNNNKNVLENIKLINVTTKNSGLHGIVVSTGSIVGEIKKDISIEIVNHTDYNSKIALGIGITRNKISNNKGLYGNIEVNGAKYFNNISAAMKNYKGIRHNVILNINNLKINNVSENPKSESMQSFLESFKINESNNIK